MIRLDTHVAVWLYSGELERLSAPAAAAVEHEDLVISPIVELEATYLHEIGRLTVTGAELTADLRGRVGLALSDLDMAAVVAAAAPLSWTRDPFDRLIVGDALAANCTLLTKDGTIREHCPLARW
ncbi:MAG: PIN domain-containing protein [Actinomycetota bacterium]|nr:PIN domain-containing protein [Actinomycetota bacterium]